MKLSILLSLTAIAVATGAPTASAQKPPAEYMQVHAFDVRPGMASGMKTLVDEIKEGLRDVDHPGFTVWEVMNGRRGRFYLSIPAWTVAETEPNVRFMESWDEERISRWTELFSRVVASHETSTWKTYPELSSPLSPDAKRWPRYAKIGIHRNGPGKRPEFQNLLEKTAKPAQDKAGVDGVYIQRRVTGGSPREWLRLSVFDDWAGLEDRRLAESMGEEAYRKMLREWGRLLDGSRYEVLRFREDLSFMRNAPQPAKASGGGAR